ncbi:major facilitator superfamily transporter multidrug resistance [Phialemonium atrogriseum]|uniref:Major facilitator superfamily transporter multidrug resistance n=1 Tax=Phialemonium atrogriseum TaxID=1093897 RepID=A0AAJ0BS19_9PEZI|nr:major facilitator superfamily transporter multidrug resistance [Phialemonium atrogriseum]KAK1763448.1 major facilitator superfamily transporter multidrug resistance [Phialemonium atrogriseum]
MDEKTSHAGLRSNSSTEGEPEHLQAPHRKRLGAGEPDIDHDEIEAIIPGHELDVELGKQGINPDELTRIETRGSVKSKVSRVLSAVSRRSKKERMPFQPLPTSNLDEGIVGWDGQDDPDMPYNFAQRKKWLIVGLLAAATLVTPFASSILSPGIAALDKDFGNENTTLGAMTVSIFLLGYCVGPLFLAPLSEIYGRKPILGFANMFFCAWQIGCALAPNLESLIVFRFFSGVGGAGCITLGAGVISDVFRTDERGFAMGIYTLGPLIGPTVGPLIGGFLAQTIGWRWDFWIVLIVSVIITTMTEVFNSETNPRVLIARKVRRLQQELGRDDLRSCYDPPNAEKRNSRILLNGLIRPTKMLFLSPLVFSLSLYIAFTYGVLYLLFTTIPVVFETQYGWSVGITGLVYISLGAGNLAGWAVVTATSDRGVVKRTKANGGVFEPEMRLPISIYFGFFLPITFFWYGWSTYYKTHWISPVLSLFPFAFGLIGLFLPILTYLVDCYPMYAASAVAANTVLRSLVGALLPLGGPSMYQNLGLGWGNSLLGFICVAMIPVPMLIYRFGARLRKAERLEL